MIVLTIVNIIVQRIDFICLRKQSNEYLQIFDEFIIKRMLDLVSFHTGKDFLIGHIVENGPSPFGVIVSFHFQEGDETLRSDRA